MFNFTVKSSTISWQKCVIAILSLVGAGRAGRDVCARLSIEDSAAYTVLTVAAESLHPESSQQQDTVLSQRGVGLGWSCLDASKDLKTDCIESHGLARYGSVGSGQGRAEWERRQGRGKTADRIARDGRGWHCEANTGRVGTKWTLLSLRER